MALQVYTRRMQIGEIFGDMRRHGFDPESTMFKYADRLSLLTLAVTLLYIWLVWIGTCTIRDELRYLVD